METLIDTNVIITYLTGRDRLDTKACIRVMDLCASGDIEGSITFHILMRKEMFS